jgi:hypothetical protein
MNCELLLEDESGCIPHNQSIEHTICILSQYKYTSSVEIRSSEEVKKDIALCIEMLQDLKNNDVEVTKPDHCTIESMVQRLKDNINKPAQPKEVLSGEEIVYNYMQTIMNRKKRQGIPCDIDSLCDSAQQKLKTTEGQEYDQVAHNMIDMMRNIVKQHD